MTLQWLPASMVVMIDVVLLGPIGNVEHIRALKHKRKGLVWETCGNKVTCTLGLKGLSVGSMGATTAVKAATTGNKTSLFGFVRTSDQAHIFAHTIFVVVGRSESVLSDGPARRENHKVANCHSRFTTGACQNSEDGRILQQKRQDSKQKI